MIVYRCTTCTHDHKNLNVQGMGMNEPTCERCGGSSFAQIHLSDVELVETSPGMPAQLQDDVAAAFDPAPPTPRDGPGPVVLEGDAQAETPEVARLRGVEGKPREVCSQADCDETATHRFTWPGHPERSACPDHAHKAMRVAEAMGFFLEVPAL